MAPIKKTVFASGWEDTDRQLRLLSGCPHLSRLRNIGFFFGYYVITDQGLKVLISLPSLLEPLKSFSLVECTVTEQGLWPLLRSDHLKQLTSVYISHCGFQGVAAVQTVVDSPNIRKLRSLTIRHNALGDEAVRALASCSNLRRLKSLDLDDCEVTNDGAVALAGSRELSNLERLDLQENAIEDAGAEALLTSPNLSKLKVLRLEWNPLSSAGRERLKDICGDRVKVVTD